MCTVLLPPGINTIAANKYIVSHQKSEMPKPIKTSLTLLVLNLRSLLHLPLSVEHDFVPQFQPVQQCSVGTLYFTKHEYFTLSHSFSKCSSVLLAPCISQNTNILLCPTVSASAAAFCWHPVFHKTRIFYFVPQFQPVQQRSVGTLYFTKHEHFTKKDPSLTLTAINANMKKMKLDVQRTRVEMYRPAVYLQLQYFNSHRSP